MVHQFSRCIAEELPKEMRTLGKSWSEHQTSDSETEAKTRNPETSKEEQALYAEVPQDPLLKDIKRKYGPGDKTRKAKKKNEKREEERKHNI